MHTLAAHSTAVWQYLSLAFATLLGGLINSVAGGGGFLVFPTLLRAGVMPIQANATGTVALLPGQGTAGFAYWQDLKGNLRLVLPAGTAAAIGGTAGAWVLLHHSQTSFLHAVPYLFLLGAGLFALSGPVSRWARARSEAAGEVQRIRQLPMVLALVPICFYIGYFGAGSGLLVMTVLTFCGVSRMAEVNALKVVITSIANGVAVILFIVNGFVEWRYCWLMMLACGIGGYVGAHKARSVSDRVLRPIIVVLGFSIAAYFFWKKP